MSRAAEAELKASRRTRKWTWHLGGMQYLIHMAVCNSYPRTSFNACFLDER